MTTYTVREAAQRTGRSEKAIRNLCDRGRLRFTVRDGRRRIIAVDLDALPPKEAAVGTTQPQATSEAIGALLDRLTVQAEELGRLRALTVEADSLRSTHLQFQAELFEARATVAMLEQRLSHRRRWLLRPSTAP